MMADTNMFVGRQVELGYISSKWTEFDLLAVWGMKSVGKTSFIRELLNQHTQCTHGKIVWVDLSNASKIDRIMLVLWEKLGFSKLPQNQEEFLKKICNFISQSSKQLLFVFDGAEGIINSRFNAEFVQMCWILIRCSKTMKLIMTSSTKLTFDTNNGQILEVTLPPLSIIESKQLLRVYAPDIDFWDSLETIAKLCEGLPLALMIAAVELNDKFLDTEEMVQLLMECRLDVLSQDVYPQQERIASVYGKFLNKLSAVFRDRLATLGYIPGSFTVQQASEIIGHASEEETLKDTINPIARRQMLQQHGVTGRFNIHGILRDCIQVFFSIKNLPEVRRRFCCIFADIMKRMSKKIDTEQYTEALCLYNLEQQNFQKLLTDVIYTREDTYCVYMNLAINSFNAIELFMGMDGFKFYSHLIDLTERNERNIDGACVKIRLGSALTNIQGNMKSGENYYSSAIKTLKEYRVEHGNTLMDNYHGIDIDCRFHLAMGYQRLGWNLGCQGRLRSAIMNLESALELETELGMYDKELILSSLQSLGIFHTASGNPKEGLKYHFEALKRRRSLYGSDDHPYVGSCINNIGLAYQLLGDVEKSYEYFETGLQIKRNTNANDKSLSISIQNVAKSLSDKGDHTKGLAKLKEAYALLDKHPGCYHEILSDLYSVKGQILIRMSLFGEAITTLKTSIVIRDQYFPNTLGNCDCYLKIAKAYRALKRDREALLWLGKVYEEKSVIISDNPTCTFVLDCCQILLEVNSSLNDSNGVFVTYRNVLFEIERLLKVYTDLGNENKTHELGTILERLQNGYKTYMQEVEEQVTLA